MAFAPIPMPQNGMDAFMTGMQQSQAMFDSMMKNKLMPYQIELLKSQSLEAQGKAQAEQTAASNFQRLTNPNFQNANEPAVTGSAPPGTYAPTGGITAMGNPAPNPAGTQESERAPGVMPPAAMAQAADRPQPNNTRMQGAPEPTNQNDQNDQSSQANQAAQNYPIGKEIVTKKGTGNPQLNSMAGNSSIEFHGMKIDPHIKESPIVDGWKTKTYPDGTETIQKVGPTYAEKQAQLMQMYDEKKLHDMNRKDSSDIEKSARALIDAHHNLVQIHGYLTRNKNLTSPMYGIPFGIGEGIAKTWGPEDLGGFDSATGRYQAAAAKVENTRGAGIGLVKFFKSIKPDKSNSMKYNIGSVKSLDEKDKAEFEDMKSEWEAKNPGKEFPYKLPELSTESDDESGNGSTVINGQEYKMIKGVLHRKKKAGAK